MIVLDTNVISEIFRPVPNARVLDWLQRQDAQQLYTTTITRGVLLFGVYVMPQGQRRETLLAGLLRIFADRFVDRVLPYDVAAADAHAELAARRRTVGRSSSQSDLMIAGIVRALGFTLATRNSRDFEDCGIALINPWD